MRPQLRDLFAIHFAAALTREQRYSIEFIVGRAYDLADAMIAERQRRLEAEVGAGEDESGWMPAHLAGGLLDEAPPPSDADAANEGEALLLDPSWLEPPYDPSWDAEKWRLEPTGAPASSRPGLARTNGPTEAEQQAKRRRPA